MSAPKRRHHYVPRLYLKVFQSAPKQIHIYNFTQHRLIRNASLRDQCYQHRFYGANDKVEHQLSMIESVVAPVLQATREDRILPHFGSNEWEVLLSFVALQMLRTSAAARKVNEGVDKMMKQAYSRDQRLGGDLESWETGYEFPALVALSKLPAMLYAISDLRLHLIVTREKPFITSDNPAFKYNQYCEPIAKDIGVRGGLSRGLQVFLPLSPSVCLLLYDGTIYKVGGLRADCSYASDEDVEAVNAIQIVSAVENVYFSQWQMGPELQRHVNKVDKLRQCPTTTVREYGAEGDSTRSLLHTFEPMPNLRLNLSFMKIKRNARRVPLLDRTRDYRKPFPMPDLPVPPSLQGRTTRFTRLLGSR